MLIIDLGDVVNLLLLNWLWLAVVMSAFWGVRSARLFHRGRGFWWWSYELIFNFVGSFFGWACFYVLLARVQNYTPIFDTPLYAQRFPRLGWVDLILFLISLLALTGHLPQVVYGLVEGFGDIGRMATKRLIAESARDS